MAEKAIFQFNGQTYKIKGRLCHDIVKYYVEQNPNATLVTLQKAFNTASNMIVATPEMALTIKDSSSKAGGNYYMKEEDRIAIKKGEVVVWNYWPESYFKPFMEQVKALGIDVVVEEPSVKADGKESRKMKLTLRPEEAVYRLVLFPIVGEKSNELVDENGLDEDTLYEIDEINANEYERKYDIVFDFYYSSNGIEYSVDDQDFEELTENILKIRSKLDLEECEEDPDDDFILVENMEEPESWDYPDSQEIFKDIKNFHNLASDDDRVDFIIDAIRRRTRHIADRLVEEGLAEDVESVRFALQYGTIWDCWYECEINSDKFDSNLLRTIDCTDWNDCRVSETLHEQWPDMLLSLVVYDGKPYEVSCEQADNFDFDLDLVDCNLHSL